VIEIGERVATIGQVKQVKVLGVMALLDEGWLFFTEQRLVVEAVVALTLLGL
jgi:inorganic pyrophosphatase